MDPMYSSLLSQFMSQTTSAINDQTSNLSNQKNTKTLMVESNESNEKAHWDDLNTEVFIRLCVEEVTNGNRPGTHFNKLGWENLVRKFANATKRKYTKVQLKNKWDNLKREWGQWKSLLHNETGLGWDDVKKTIDAPATWWDRKIKANPIATKFREKGPLLRFEQEMLFSDVVANGTSSWTPSSGIVIPHMQDDFNNIPRVELQDDDVNIPPAKNFAETIVQSDSSDEMPAEKQSDPIQSRRRKSADFLKQIKQKKSKKPPTVAGSMVKCLARIADNMENPQGDAYGPFSIPSCLEILENLPEVEPTSDLWTYATRIFLKSEIRILFVSFKKDEHRVKWLKSQMEKDIELRATSNNSVRGSRGGDSWENNTYSG